MWHRVSESQVKLSKWLFLHPLSHTVASPLSWLLVRCDKHSPVPSSFQSQHRFLYYFVSPILCSHLDMGVPTPGWACWLLVFPVLQLLCVLEGGRRRFLSFLLWLPATMLPLLITDSPSGIVKQNKPLLPVCSCLLSWSVLQQQKSNTASGHISGQNIQRSQKTSKN